MRSEIIRSDFAGLNTFVKGISSRSSVRIGIFGNKSTGRKEVEHVERKGVISARRTKTAAHLTNAEVGLLHEFGSLSRGIPPRSFLRMPLLQKAQSILKDASDGALSMIAQGETSKLLKRMGIACEKAIQEAFASGGFGSWAPNKASTIRRKGSSSPLIDSGQLRRSITSQVEKR